MEIYDLNILVKDTNTNLYDLTSETFVLNNIPQYSITVSPEQEMRIDLISKYIYGSVDYADFLLNLNDIDNPLNILSGDIIKYETIDKMDNFKIKPSTTTTNTRNTLLSPNKVTKVDSNRQQYVQNQYQLSPTILSNPGNAVSTSPGVIKISNIQ